MNKKKILGAALMGWPVAVVSVLAAVTMGFGNFLVWLAIFVTVLVIMAIAAYSMSKGLSLWESG